jgi:RNA polymerase sigma-70 factor (ECF subfamily)
LGNIGWAELERLYELFAPVVHRRALQILGRDADAWDAVQEVFRRLLESSSEFRAEARPMTYVYRTTVNVCLNMLRARVVREPAGLSLAEELSEHIESAAEARDLLGRLTGTLSERSLQVFCLHFMDGLTQDEIAEVLGVSRKTIVRDLDSIRVAARSLAHSLA